MDPRFDSSLHPASPRPCANCYFKETAGMMVDPCFPCLLETDFTGQPKKQYDYWRHESTTAEQLRKERADDFAAFERALEANPELKRELDRLFK